MTHVDTRDPYLFDGKWEHVTNDSVGGGKQFLHKIFGDGAIVTIEKCCDAN